ncbi:hypothetical protein HZ326_17427 [Fusarium oxysporum f. sp. albedinis]|nr:hypothetical protein HZ326_17427 [Fusarium oxysporum f. sp. albedinis]
MPDIAHPFHPSRKVLNLAILGLSDRELAYGVALDFPDTPVRLWLVWLLGECSLSLDIYNLNIYVVTWHSHQAIRFWCKRSTLERPASCTVSLAASAKDGQPWHRLPPVYFLSIPSGQYHA